MLNKYISHRKIYLLFLLILIIGISLGKFFMSVGTIGLSANYLLEGNFNLKMKRLRDLKFTPLILSFAFILHLLFLFNTNDFSYALKDLLIKVPLFALPLIIGTSNILEKKEISILIYTFLLGLFISASISLLAFYEIIPAKNNSSNFRDISFFMSNIRFSILLAFSFFVCMFIHIKLKEIKLKTILLLLSLYFVCILFILQSITGIVAWFIAAVVFILWFLYYYKKIIPIIISFIFFISASLYIANVYNDFFSIKDTRDLNSLPNKTKLENKYNHNINSNITENGYYLWICISENELRDSWNKLSDIKFDSLDNKNQYIKYTLYRYLTSKGLNKDAEALSKLSINDIQRIESGATSAMKYSSIELRLRELFFEYQLYQNNIGFNGHSILQRIYFLNVGLKIAKENFFFGVGLGDVPLAFKEYYKNSLELDKQNQLRAHNQFLTYFITYGIFGFVIWLFTILYPVIVCRNNLNILYLLFSIIIGIAFLSDDMLERQAGVAIYITINSLLLFAIKERT